MSDSTTMTKKKWSKKKKILVIFLCIFLTLFIAVFCAGLVVLHNYCKTADYTVASVASGEDVNLIAHRGFRAVAPENTTASFEKAGEAKFYGAECDTFRTKDGVWIISHDFSTYRMMDKTANVEKKTYDELMTYTVDNGVNIADYPGLKMCSLEEYLQICAKYSMKAVIELKSKNGTEYYNEIVDLINKTGADAMFISFYIEDLQAMRKVSDAPMWYLAQKVTDEDIAAAKALGGECGIDFNAAKEENNQAMVDKCTAEGLEVGAWTVDDMDTVNRLLDMGVKNITTDCVTY